MTFEEIKAKYGHIKLKFWSYYKYNFIYKGEEGGVVVKATCKCDSEDIYYYDVLASEELTLSSLDPEGVEVYSGGKRIACYCKYTGSMDML